MLGFFRRPKWRRFPFCRHQHRTFHTTKPAAAAAATATTVTLRDIVKRSIDTSPATMRRFWRVSFLQPHHVLQILLQFDADVDVRSDTSRKVLIMWELFLWASDSQNSFRHLPTSYHLMASMLLNARMLEEAEFLLFHAEERGVVLSSGFYGDVVREYVSDRELDKSLSLFRRARRNGIVFRNTPALYHELLRLLAESKDCSAYLQVYFDMVEQGIGSGVWFHELAVRTLCREKKLLEAADVARRAKEETFDFTDLAGLADMIADGYCNRQDFESLLKFLKDWGSAPGVAVCNKIVSALCTIHGSDRAWSFLQTTLEHLGGFKADSTTFRILISWTCKERKVRNAFLFMSELLARKLVPDVHAYNALISALFLEGMSEYAWEIFTDMVEFGVRPGASTFRVLLAGYSRERKFDAVTLVLKEMTRLTNQVSLSPLDDTFSKVFTLLGLDSLGVKIKRISHTGHQQAEFFDSVGNGLYLDTDTDDYDKILTEILDSAMLPDFNLAVVEECEQGNTETALQLEKEATRHGQKLTPSTYSALLQHLSGVDYTTKKKKTIFDLFTGMQESFNELDPRTLNLLAQMLNKNGFTARASLVVDVLCRRQLPTESKTFDSLITDLYRRRDKNRFWKYWEVARRNNWFPRPGDFKVYLRCLSKFGMVKEIVDLFQNTSQNYPLSVSKVIADVVKELCLLGSTSTAWKLLKEEEEEEKKKKKRDPSLDHKLHGYIIQGFCREDKPTEAVELLSTMLLDGRKKISIDLFRLVIVLLLRFGHMDMVLNLKRVLLQEHSKASSSLYEAMIGELSNVWKLSQVETEMKEMMIGGVFPSNNVLNTILNGHAKKKNTAKACQLLCLMHKTNLGLSIQTYRNLIRQGNMQNSLVVINCLKLINLSTREANHSSSLPFYNVLTFTLFRAGNHLPLVEVVLDEMQRRNLVLDEVSYNFLVFGYNRCGDTAKSVEALNSMLSRGMNPSHRSFRIAISYLCIHSNKKRALELSEVMGRLGVKQGSIIQSALIGTFLSDGEFETAESLSVRSVKYDRICYDMVIRKLCDYRRTSMATELLNTMLKKGNSPSETSYNLVIQRLLAQGELDHALDFHVEMQQMNLHPSLDTCSDLVRSLCGNGRTVDARSLLEATLHSGMLLPSSIIYLVVDRYLRENDLGQASSLLQKMQQYGYLLDFGIQWSFVSNLSDSSSTCKEDRERNQGFLTHLLRESGFSSKTSKPKGDHHWH